MSKENFPVNVYRKEQYLVLVTPNVSGIICSQTPCECVKANSDTEIQLLLIPRSFSS